MINTANNTVITKITIEGMGPVLAKGQNNGKSFYSPRITKAIDIMSNQQKLYYYILKTLFSQVLFIRWIVNKGNKGTRGIGKRTLEKINDCIGYNRTGL